MAWKCVQEEDSPDMMLNANHSWICWPRRIGSNIILYGYKKSYFPFHILVGPEWRIFLQTSLQINIITIIFIIFITEKISRILTIFTICLLSITCLSYTLTACSDPGIVFHDNTAESTKKEEDQGKKNEEEKDLESAPIHTPETGLEITKPAPTSPQIPNPNQYNEITVRTTIECQQCHVQRPVTARHCYKCGVCIDKLDHHCPFTGKCIGKKNMLPFQIFVGSISLLGMLVFGVSAYYIIGVLIVNAATA